MSQYIGKQLGNYRVLRLLGEGAFAQVYLGEHIYLNTQAAIKVLKTQTTDYPIEMFYSEARNVARLIHPNIVRVLEFGVESDVPFLVLDYAPNGTLRQRYPAGMILPFASVVSNVKQISEALQYAHDEKLIHRDIKPENMLLGRRNEVLLTDFGIAFMVQSMQHSGIQEVAGTLPYMSPEQIQGKPRPASDQYALAIIAYEWLSGNRPFKGTVTEIISQHLAAPPPPLRALRSAVSPEIEEVIIRALAKDPDERFANVRAFATALEQASQSKIPEAKSVQQVPEEKSIAQPAMVKQQEAVRQVHTEPPRHAIPPLTQPIQIGTIVSSYRGQRVPARALSWSPDNQRIVSTGNDGSIHVWDAMTGSRPQFYQGSLNTPQVAGWSFDGMRIAAAGEDALVRYWDVNTGRLFGPYQGHEGSAITALAWSPSQPIHVTGAANGSIQVWDATTGQALARFQGHSGSVNGLAWSPFEVATPYGRSHHIVSGGDDGMLRIWEAATGRCIATYPSQSTRVATVSWSPNVYSSYSRQDPVTSMHNSSRVACGTADGMIKMWDTSVNREVLSYRYTAPITTVTWSPDGRRFAYASAGQPIEIWDTLTNLKLFSFSHPVAQRTMAWSRDGKYIASAGDDGAIQVWKAPQ